MPVEITYDTENYSSWASREVTTDERGYLISRTTIYDNGISITETTALSEQGLAMTRLDLEDVTPWESYTSTRTFYSTYSTLRHFTVFDNGIERSDSTRLNSEIDYRQVSEVDTANVKDWASWDMEYNDDGLAEYFIYFDNGVEERNLYSQREGRDDTRVLLDHDDAFNWDVKNFAYNQDGEIQSSKVTSDNGNSIESVFEAGQLAQTTNLDSADQYSWSEIVITYEEGQKVAKVTNSDNGIVRTELWENGQRTETDQADTVDAKTWDTQSTYFDVETGQIAGISINYDNGMQRDTLYLNGVRSIQETRDTADSFSWNTKTVFYTPDGARIGSETKMDTGDKIIFAFQEDDGQRDWRLEADGDNSELWTYRVTEYDADGINPEVTTYGALEDLPEPYVDYLGYAAVG